MVTCQGSSLNSKIFSNTLFQIAGKGFSFFLSIISIMLLTRFLGVEGYGNFSLVFSYLTLFGFISDMGLNLLITREFSRYDKQFISHLHTYLFIKGLLIIASVVVSLIVLIFLPYSDQIKCGVIIGLIGVIITSLIGFINSFFQAKLRMDIVTIIDQFIKIITILFIALSVILKLNFYFIILSVVLGNISGLLFIFIFYRKSALKLLKSSSFDISAIKDIHIDIKILRNSLLMGLMSLFAYTYFKIDTLLLSILRPSKELGVYVISYKIIENILLVWGFYMASIYPLLSRYYLLNKNLQKQIYKNTLYSFLVISILGIYIGYFHSSLVISILGGPNFRESIIPLKILIFSVPFFLINNIIYHYLIVSNKITNIIISLFIALCINLILNIIFIPRYGYIASAYITLITELALFLCYFINTKLYYRKL